MVLRLFLLFGLVLLGGTGWFIVGSQPPTVQATPIVAEVTRLQESGVIPKGEIEENPEIEHGIFETPPEDEVHLEEAMANMGSMPGMDMGGDGGMDMGSDGGGMDMDGDGKVLDMDMDGDGVMDMSSTDMKPSGGMDMGSDGGGMDMAGDGGGMDMDGDGGGMDMDGDGGGMDMAGDGKVLDMDMDGDGVMDMSSTDMKPSGGMDMGSDGGMDMAMAPDGEMDEEEAAKAMAQQMAGLVISEDGDYDREISLSMSEWTFAPLNIEVQKGERIKFTLRNDGTLLHEFMFMTMAEMQAINYRAKRADWSLYEHEALFEKSLLLPGQELTFVAEITKPGSWMFMCMLPYHMQMGMMGQLATPGAAMKM